MQASKRKIVLLGTGGTIAGVTSTDRGELGYTAAQIGIDALVESMRHPRAHTFVTEQVAQLDSKDMDFGTWRKLAARCQYWLDRDDVRAVLITHGTDTLEETAYFLHAVIAPVKPVVLVGAMRPADAMLSDGPQNLLDALAVATTVGARGVLAVSSGAVHSALDIVKVQPYRLDAFDSGDVGAVAYVEAGRVRRLRSWPTQVSPTEGARRLLQREPEQWPWVEIVTSCAGSRADAILGLVAQGVDGLVIAGTGNACVHQALEQALEHARAHGVRILLATRCLGGKIVLPHGPTQFDSTTLTPVKARIALTIELALHPRRRSRRSLSSSKPAGRGR